MGYLVSARKGLGFRLTTVVALRDSEPWKGWRINDALGCTGHNVCAHCQAHCGLAMRHNHTSAGELTGRAHVIIRNGWVHLGRLSLQRNNTESLLFHTRSSKHDEAIVPMGNYVAAIAFDTVIEIERNSPAVVAHALISALERQREVDL